ncbi:hypothetical protein EYR40_010372 [Pleurotus pulmonarius]|nr:hypothetical protein EYR36_010237 [Pleurotus pulmonarius]KAF4588817.1 hypothetical protein EYR40_010372 [Pleurotus pulmonarius]
MVDPTPNFDLYAPYFTGLTLTLAFYGVALAQSIFYFRVYREDKVYLKIVVVSLMSTLEKRIPHLHLYEHSSTGVYSQGMVLERQQTIGISDLRQFHLGSVIFMQKNIILRIVQLCSSTACDLLIACSLVYLLRVNYQRVLSSTRNMIDTLIVICIGVGLVTS